MAQLFEEPMPTSRGEEVHDLSPSPYLPGQSPLATTLDLGFVKRRYAVIMAEIDETIEEVKRLYSGTQDKRASTQQLAARVERMETATKRYSILLEEEIRRSSVQLLMESREVFSKAFDRLISDVHEQLEKGKQELEQLVAARKILERVREQTDFPVLFASTSTD